MTTATKNAMTYDVARIRQDFPALQQHVHGQPLAYLDNAATSQKPQTVLDALDEFNKQDCANIHRGVHTLSMRATKKYEQARTQLQQFIHAKDSKEIIFVRGTTEGINLIAQSYGRPRLQAGDEILITHLEHHSNIVPWQLLCEQTGAVLKVAPINDAGEVIQEEYEKLLTPQTRIVAISHVSNALGTILPVKSMLEKARSVGAITVVDGAQAAPHMLIDVQDLDCDFYTISAHKMYGPTGVGVLFGRVELLEEMPPYQGGGDMIKSVSFNGTQYNDLPYKFEAGTPNIAAGIAFGAAVDYLNNIGLERIAAFEAELLEYATQVIGQNPKVQLVGTAANKASVLSFTLEGVHPHDTGTILDQAGIAIRTGHHCAQPVMERFGIPATARASFGCYNTKEEVDRLAKGIQDTLEMFGA